LDAMEKVLKEEQVTINKLDQLTRVLLEKAQETDDEADQHVNTCARLQEELEWRVSVVSLREVAVVRREQDLQEKEEEIDGKLECEHRELESHFIDLSTCEAVIEAEHERLQKTREDLCNCELSISFQEGTLASRANALASMERDLADKEKRLAEKELQKMEEL
jgi:hypothetical protein